MPEAGKNKTKKKIPIKEDGRQKTSKRVNQKHKQTNLDLEGRVQVKSQKEGVGELASARDRTQEKRVASGIVKAWETGIQKKAESELKRRNIGKKKPRTAVPKTYHPKPLSQKAHPHEGKTGGKKAGGAEKKKGV